MLILILLFIALLVGIVLILWKVKPMWRKLLVLVVCLGVFALVSFKIVIPLKAPLAPSGPLSVKDETLYFAHETQFEELATGENQRRELPVRVWMPEDAESNDVKLPLVLFSHGSFGLSTSNESLFHELASRGYIVASSDHPHHSFFTKLSDGKLVTVDPQFMNEVMSSQGSQDLTGTLEDLEKWTAIRVEDLNFLLDEILTGAQNASFTQLIDKERIILSGHSLGGSAVLELADRRPQDVIGVISLEAPFVGSIEGVDGETFVFDEENPQVPILHFYSDALWGKLGDITTYGMNQRLIDVNSPDFVNVHISGSGHIGLTDMSLVSPILTNLIDGGMNTKDVYDKLAEINEASVAFLEQIT